MRGKRTRGQDKEDDNMRTGSGGREQEDRIRKMIT